LFHNIICKNKFQKIDLNKLIKNSVLGIFLGIGWIGIPILILLLIGKFQWGEINYIPYLYLWIISAFLNVIMQEYLVRGFIFNLLQKKYSVIIAVIVTTIIFTLFHGGAFEVGIIAVFNVLTMSVFVSLLLIYTTNLLSSIIVHAIWNIIGFLLGNVALADDYPVLINCIINGNKIISGGIYKLEGSIIVLFVNIILIILLLFLIKNKENINNKNKSNCT
jgi:membrane protease YdiL (CAAX protease family)